MGNPDDLAGNVIGMQGLIIGMMKQMAAQGGQRVVHAIYQEAIAAVQDSPHKEDAEAFLKRMAPLSADLCRA